MDLSAPEVDTEMVDLSGVTFAALGSLDPAAVDHAARLLLDTDRRPTLGSASQGGTCSDGGNHLTLQVSSDDAEPAARPTR